MDAETKPVRALPSSMSSRWYNDPDYDPADPWKSLNPARSALVLIDLINWQADPDGASIRSIREAGLNKRADHLTARCAQVLLPGLRKVLRAARDAGVLVVHARLASRHPDYQDIVPALQPYVRAARAQEGSWECRPLPELGQETGDLSVVKTGSGAFTGSDLDFLLRRLNIDTLLYAGVVTNACVMLSVAGGFDLGYRQYLITDCTGALSDEDQADAERFIGGYMAELVDSEQTVSALQRATR